jgi:HEAT repeat protein
MFISIILGLNLLSVPPADALSQNSELWARQLKSDSVDLRVQALKKLAELRQPATLPKIADALSDLSPEVRFQAMRAMTRMPNADSLNSLQLHLNQETDPYLISELRRSVKSVEDSIKQAQEKAEKATLKNSRLEKEPKKTKK